MAITAITMPKWGMTMQEGEFTEWNVAEGDTVAVEDNLGGISSDKIEGELPSPAAGVIRRLIAESGQSYEVGALLGVIADADTPDAEIEAFIAQHG